jgi:O-antigen biosynthesis protein
MVATPIRVSSPLGTPTTAGKFLHVGDERFLIRGVTYGSFSPRSDGHQFPEGPGVQRDFALMAAAGINTVRTYTVPPPDVLDAAAAHGLRIMAGLAWPQHVAFLEDRHLCREIIQTIASQAAAIARHPALLLTAVGNEIPPAVVRWHGTRRVERFIHAAVDAVRSAAPRMLLTYANYPPTEFLELPFLDVHAFNVYLHDEQAMRAYVTRLHHCVGDRPLLLAECGADSRRHGEHEQARLAAMQVRVAFGEGACGAIVFAWTDQWWRGGALVHDWSFGLVDRNRRPKPAHTAVAQAFAAAPFTPTARRQWPSVSVIVCAYNAAATIDDCLSALGRVDYPDVEVIVVDDGSTDDTAERTLAYPWARLIRVPNGGLSAARNVGLHAAAGEIVAYVDADVRVEPCWLTYLVQPFADRNVAAAGGPNVVPADDGWFAQCVARSPGAPNHVLLDDRIAEHVPGCNLAIRREALLQIGGFDPIFLRAGDDVDVCWRLQEDGRDVAFSPAALVWHHHRGSLAAYWRQQVGYGEGEAWLRLRHRRRFSGGSVNWRGRIYSGLPFVRSLTERRLHSGVWGTAAFPTVYHIGAHPLQAMPHTPEWQLGALLLAVGGGIALAAGTDTTGALIASAAGLGGLAVTLLKCAIYARRSEIDGLPPVAAWRPSISRLIYRTVIAWLHVVQPFARTRGYIRGILRSPSTSPGDATSATAAAPPARNTRRDFTLLLGKPAQYRFWSEAWTSADALLTRIVDRLRIVRLGRGIQVDDGWRADRDITIALGPWGWAHMQALVEDHGTGRCLFRVRVNVRPRGALLVLAMLAAAAITSGALYGRLVLAALVATAALALVARVVRDVARDTRQILDVLVGVASDSGMQGLPAGPREPGAEAPGGSGAGLRRRLMAGN